MATRKSKEQLDEDLNEALKETFPGSDAIALDGLGDTPIRPIDRRPPVIDTLLVEALAQEVRKAVRGPGPIKRNDPICFRLAGWP